MSKTYVVPPAAPLNHGKTVAANVMLWGVVVGFAAAALGLILGSVLVVVVGAVVVAAAIVLSVVLRAAGKGQPTRSPERAGASAR